ELDVAPLDADPAREGVLDFAARLFAPGVPALPSAVVVDVGRIGEDWAVVEANAAWASGHYACDEDAVLDGVLRAAAPAQGPGTPAADGPSPPSCAERRTVGPGVRGRARR